MRAMGVLTMAGIGLLALAAGAAAQNRVQILGRVLDDQSGDPIVDVDLAARTVADAFLGSATTDEAGRFSFTVYRIDAIRIYAARFGYKRTSTPVLRFDGNDYFEVELRLHPDALLLAPLEVIARREAQQSPVLAGFRHRMQRGAGYYITRAEIERRNPMFISDMLLDVPGIRSSSSGRGARRILRMARTEAWNCSLQLFVDGVLMTPRVAAMGEIPVDDLVSPGSVEGIEVYRGLSTVPAEFLNENARCGVIAIWTRRGDDPSARGRGPSP